VPSDNIVEIHLAQIDGKLDLINERLDQMCKFSEGTNQRLDHINGRLRATETEQVVAKEKLSEITSKVAYIQTTKLPELEKQVNAASSRWFDRAWDGLNSIALLVVTFFLGNR
jgi:predicted nuclease with TOPRIM domain